MERVNYGHEDLPKCEICGRRFAEHNGSGNFYCSMKCANIAKYQSHPNIKEVEVLLRQYYNGGVKGY